jgi:hypothetical protein
VEKEESLFLHIGNIGTDQKVKLTFLTATYIFDFRLRGKIWQKTTGIFTVSCVPLHMQREVVTSCKGPVTQVALEWFAPSMLSVMAGQLI